MRDPTGRRVDSACVLRLVGVAWTCNGPLSTRERPELVVGGSTVSKLSPQFPMIQRRYKTYLYDVVEDVTRSQSLQALAQGVLHLSLLLTTHHPVLTGLGSFFFCVS